MRDLVAVALRVNVGKRARGAGQHAQARNGLASGGAFLALLVEQLKAEADAQKRHARLDALDEQVGQPQLAQGLHRIGERADAGQHDGARRGNRSRIVGDAGVSAHADQPALDGLQISLVVVNDCNHETPQRIERNVYW